MSSRLNKDCNILTPTLLAIAAFLPRSPVLLNRGPEGSASARFGSNSSNLNADFTLWSPNDWHPVAPVLYNYLTPTCFLWRHNLHSIQTVDSQGYPPISSTWCTCYLHRSISHLTARRSVCYKIIEMKNYRHNRLSWRFIEI